MLFSVYSLHKNEKNRSILSNDNDKVDILIMYETNMMRVTIGVAGLMMCLTS